MKRLRGGLIGLALAALLAAPAAAHAAASCNGLLLIDYVSHVGNTVGVRITLGTGDILGGTKLTIDQLQFNLDCDSNFPLVPPCTDEGPVVEYEGDATISTTCPVTLEHRPSGGHRPERGRLHGESRPGYSGRPADAPGVLHPGFRREDRRAGHRWLGPDRRVGRVPGGALRQRDSRFGRVPDGRPADDESTTTTTTTPAPRPPRPRTTTPHDHQHDDLHDHSTTTLDDHHDDLYDQYDDDHDQHDHQHDDDVPPQRSNDKHNDIDDHLRRRPPRRPRPPRRRDAVHADGRASGRIGRLSPTQLPATVASRSAARRSPTWTIDDAHSALEALCGPDVAVMQQFQCCRQLMAAALNAAAGGAVFPDFASVQCRPAAIPTRRTRMSTPVRRQRR